MRIAVLADIHGNLPALEAVLADLREQRPDQIYLAGDQVNRCPWNREVMDVVTESDWVVIHGNHDLVVGWIKTAENRPPFTSRSDFPTLWWTQESLSEAHLASLRAWPAEVVIAFDGLPVIRLFHGLPDNAFVGILPENRDEQIQEWLHGVKEQFIVCAHTHRPLARVVPPHRIYNGGSVGIPYNGDPRAQYLLLDGGPKGWQPSWRKVDYDHSPIPAAFSRSGLYDIAGPIAGLQLRTIMSAEPWISDFGYWLRFQPATVQADKNAAVATYLQQHGPGRWAFRRVLDNQSNG